MRPDGTGGPNETKSRRGELTEAEAIRRAQQGDADAFERIYQVA